MQRVVALCLFHAFWALGAVLLAFFFFVSMREGSLSGV